MTRRTTTLTAVLTSAALAAGTLSACTSLPESSAPEAVSSYVPVPSEVNAPEPVDGQPSDLHLRDFFTASAHPPSDYAAAQRFLTKSASERWSTSPNIVILDRMDITATGAATNDTITYQVRGNVIGRLGSGGIFEPEFTAYETNYQLVRDNGQWRINTLPNEVVLDRTDFMAAYEARDIFFAAATSEALVPDRRWIYNRQQSLGASVISLLGAGPQNRLIRGVRRIIPSDATVTITASDALEPSTFTVTFTGLGDISPAERGLLAAQVTWTLADADVRGPYTINADGAPLVADHNGPWYVEDVSQFDPAADPATPLRAVSNGALLLVDGDSARPVEGWANREYVESASVSLGSTNLAIVAGRDEEERRLIVGRPDGTPTTPVRGPSLTRPSWGPDATSLYTVVDGRQVVRVSRSEDATPTASPAPAVTQTVSDVSTDAITALRDERARISMFSVSNDGARAAMIINGRVYISVLERGDNGTIQLGSPVQIGFQLGDTAVSLDWYGPDSILVGTRANDAPVWSLAIDGSVATQLSSRNVNAPIVAVASTPDYLYATDGRALMQLSRTDSGPMFWREVPALIGERALPVLTY